MVKSNKHVDSEPKRYLLPEHLVDRPLSKNEKLMELKEMLEKEGEYESDN